MLKRFRDHLMMHLHNLVTSNWLYTVMKLLEGKQMCQCGQQGNQWGAAVTGSFSSSHKICFSFYLCVRCDVIREKRWPKQQKDWLLERSSIIEKDTLTAWNTIMLGHMLQLDVHARSPQGSGEGWRSDDGSCRDFRSKEDWVQASHPAPVKYHRLA